MCRVLAVVIWCKNQFFLHWSWIFNRLFFPIDKSSPAYISQYIISYPQHQPLTHTSKHSEGHRCQLLEGQRSRGQNIFRKWNGKQKALTKINRLQKHNLGQKYKRTVQNNHLEGNDWFIITCGFKHGSFGDRKGNP